MDAASAARYSTAPAWARGSDAPAHAWRHHWRQCVAFLPGAGVRVNAGQPVTLRGCHDDHSLWFHVHASAAAADDGDAAALLASRPPADPAPGLVPPSRARGCQPL